MSERRETEQGTREYSKEASSRRVWDTIERNLASQRQWASTLNHARRETQVNSMQQEGKSGVARIQKCSEKKEETRANKIEGGLLSPPSPLGTRGTGGQATAKTRRRCQDWIPGTLPRTTGELTSSSWPPQCGLPDGSGPRSRQNPLRSRPRTSDRLLASER